MPLPERMKNSQFWIVLASFVSTGLTLCGVLSLDSVDYFQSIATHSVESVILVSTQVALAMKYMSNRRQVKEAEVARLKIEADKVEADKVRQHELDVKAHELELLKLKDAESEKVRAELRESILAAEGAKIREEIRVKLAADEAEAKILEAKTKAEKKKPVRKPRKKT